MDGQIKRAPIGILLANDRTTFVLSNDGMYEVLWDQSEIPTGGFLLDGTLNLTDDSGQNLFAG